MSLTDGIPRLRMFAGPNGSGKSTTKLKIGKRLLGVFINADDIEAEIKQTGFLNFQKFGVVAQEAETLNFFLNSAFLKKADLISEAEKLNFNADALDFSNVRMNSYFASVAADYIRRKLVYAKSSFSFETVMSSSDKVEFLKTSRQNGYRNYLYYVATNDPLINIFRVEHRVKKGGTMFRKKK